jgi:hypothetical protein
MFEKNFTPDFPIVTPDSNNESKNYLQKFCRLVPALSLILLTSCTQQKPEKSYPWTDYSKPENQFGYEPPITPAQKKQKEFENEGQVFYDTVVHECRKKRYNNNDYKTYLEKVITDQEKKLFEKDNPNPNSLYRNYRSSKIRSVQQSSIDQQYEKLKNKLDKACTNLGKEYYKKYDPEEYKHLLQYGQSYFDISDQNIEPGKIKDLYARVEAMGKTEEHLPQIKLFNVPEIECKNMSGGKDSYPHEVCRYKDSKKTFFSSRWN